MLKRTLLAVFFASSLGAVAVPAIAHIVVVDVPPPAPRHEPIPPHRAGYIWESGHWRWNGHRYVWAPGHWVHVRHGYRHVPPRWVERDGRWEYHARRWDRDRDGVPDRYDRHPDNPRRS